MSINSPTLAPQDAPRSCWRSSAPGDAIMAPRAVLASILASLGFLGRRL